MNLQKHEQVNYRKIGNLSKLLNSRLYKRHEPVYVDGECQFFEVVSKKRKIVDKVPISTAFFILGNAKLCVLEFIKDIENCIQPDAMRILYMGTLNRFFRPQLFKS